MVAKSDEGLQYPSGVLLLWLCEIGTVKPVNKSQHQCLTDVNDIFGTLVLLWMRKTLKNARILYPVFSPATRTH